MSYYLNFFVNNIKRCAFRTIKNIIISNIVIKVDSIWLKNYAMVMWPYQLPYWAIPDIALFAHKNKTVIALSAETLDFLSSILTCYIVICIHFLVKTTRGTDIFRSLRISAKFRFWRISDFASQPFILEIYADVWCWTRR